MKDWIVRYQRGDAPEYKHLIQAKSQEEAIESMKRTLHRSYSWHIVEQYSFTATPVEN